MRRRAGGVTLVEILVASLLVSLVFLAAATLYLTAMKFLKTASSGQAEGVNLDHRLAVAMIEDPVFAANLLDFGGEFQLDAVTKGYRQLKVRVDNPKFTLFNKAGDDWHVYGFVAEPDGTHYSLRGWKTTPSMVPADPSWRPPDAAAADPELVPGLLLDQNAAFIKIDPAPSGRARIVRIQLLKDAANPQNSVWRDVAAEAMTK
ncbi:MAG: prepilin-type N-terminal cleavage/methylation domain-containing protein [Candidatus Omnitrophica bacterium]|nr:prepilin-type N-terminal cleavage/methylation domain-containing protein [Candidatus Omnitrophota bacterium]